MSLISPKEVHDHPNLGYTRFITKNKKIGTIRLHFTILHLRLRRQRNLKHFKYNRNYVSSGYDKMITGFNRFFIWPVFSYMCETLKNDMLASRKCCSCF